MKPDLKDRADLDRLVHLFYDKLLVDETVAHLFTEVAKINLSEHLPILVDFWENVLFQRGAYRRNTMKFHTDLHQKHPLTDAHFDRWLALFNESVDELFAGEMAHHAKVRALSIATIMRIKIHNLENP